MLFSSLSNNSENSDYLCLPFFSGVPATAAVAVVDDQGALVLASFCQRFVLIFCFVLQLQMDDGAAHGQRPKTINKYKNKSTAIESASIENVLFIFCEPKNRESRERENKNEMGWMKHCEKYSKYSTQIRKSGALSLYLFHIHKHTHWNPANIRCDCTSRPIKQIYFTINNKSLKIFSICAII